MPRSRAEASNYRWSRYNETGSAITLEIHSTFDPDGYYFELQMFAPKSEARGGAFDFITERVGHAKVVCSEKNLSFEIRVTATPSPNEISLDFETWTTLDKDGRLSAPTCQTAVYKHSSPGCVVEVQRIIHEPQVFSVSVVSGASSLFQ
ncbi:hypothetical protein MMC14_006614 [Varicellaria rhodocarpa]|nr:hypothetical protein [Varicellaria rhodocarpa]